jgi:hypothetical protein
MKTMNVNKMLLVASPGAVIKKKDQARTIVLPANVIRRVLAGEGVDVNGMPVRKP